MKQLNGKQSFFFLLLFACSVASMAFLLAQSHKGNRTIPAFDPSRDPWQSAELAKQQLFMELMEQNGPWKATRIVGLPCKRVCDLALVDRETAFTLAFDGSYKLLKIDLRTGSIARSIMVGKSYSHIQLIQKQNLFFCWSEFLGTSVFSFPAFELVHEVDGRSPLVLIDGKAAAFWTLGPATKPFVLSLQDFELVNTTDRSFQNIANGESHLPSTQEGLTTFFDVNEGVHKLVDNTTNEIVDEFNRSRHLNSDLHDRTGKKVVFDPQHGFFSENKIGDAVPFSPDWRSLSSGGPSAWKISPDGLMMALAWVPKNQLDTFYLEVVSTATGKRISSLGRFSGVVGGIGWGERSNSFGISVWDSEHLDSAVGVGGSCSILIFEKGS